MKIFAPAGNFLRSTEQLPGRFKQQRRENRQGP